MLICLIAPFPIGAIAVRAIDIMTDSPIWAQIVIWFLMWYMSTKFVSRFGQLVVIFVGRINAAAGE